MDWQPIETAPRDGTWVLLCGGETSEDDYMETGVECHRIVTAFWSDEDDAWPVAFWDGDWRTFYENPTHWMPLPEPPQ